jgi:NADH:ubiquinone oxidoreductase subunit 3 (subunit A)
LQEEPVKNLSEIIFTPPIAFALYFGFTALIYAIGRMLAGRGVASELKSSTYSSGEAPPLRAAAPGYRPFFVAALFFAVLHLGALVLGSGGLSLETGLYLTGLFLALLVLILG